MIGFLVKSSPYSSSRVKEVLRAAVGATMETEVEVLLLGPGEGCLDAEEDDWADELGEHLSTLEELATVSVGHGRLEGFLEEADRVVTV